MKLNIFTVFMLSCSLTFQSCWYSNTDDDGIPEIVNYYEPVILERSEFNNSTSLQTTPEIIVNSGKIYVKDNFIFINERNKGFHIINNTDPSNPQNIAFLNVLGSSDLTIKGNAIYVNNATDLLALALDTQAGTVEVTKRVPNAFPQITSPFGNLYYNINENEVVVDWVLNENID